MGDPELRPLRLSFGSVAETYHSFRPRYFQPLLDRAQEALELRASAHVLDLAAGTGRLTRELAQRFARVIAVEPDERMRALIADGEILEGAAEAIPLGDDSVDAVFVGEAFQWFDASVALAEIARVLRPGGGLAAIRTHWWETEPPLPERVLELLREPFERTLGERNPPWQEKLAGAPFEPLRSEPFEEETTVDADTLLAMYSTTSALAALDEDERAELFAEIRGDLAGPYRLPIQHELSWTRLAAA
jgi:SAM-dependent methyltransferase